MSRGTDAQHNEESSRQLIFVMSRDVLVGVEEVQGVVAQHAGLILILGSRCDSDRAPDECRRRFLLLFSLAPWPLSVIRVASDGTICAVIGRLFCRVSVPDQLESHSQKQSTGTRAEFRQSSRPAIANFRVPCHSPAIGRLSTMVGPPSSHGYFLPLFSIDRLSFR